MGSFLAKKNNYRIPSKALFLLTKALFFTFCCVSKKSLPSSSLSLSMEYACVKIWRFVWIPLANFYLVLMLWIPPTQLFSSLVYMASLPLVPIRKIFFFCILFFYKVIEFMLSMQSLHLF